jgi:hypothetical protein
MCAFPFFSKLIVHMLQDVSAESGGASGLIEIHPGGPLNPLNPKTSFL